MKISLKNAKYASSAEDACLMRKPPTYSLQIINVIDCSERHRSVPSDGQAAPIAHESTVATVGCYIFF
jgi:hypothetical protein